MFYLFEFNMTFNILYSLYHDRYFKGGGNHCIGVGQDSVL